MLNYHAYKALHLVGLIIFLMSLVRHHHSEKIGRLGKSILFGSLALAFSTGTAMTIRWGLVETIPPWIWGKYVVILGMAISIWFPKSNSKLIYIRPYFLGLLVVAGVICSVYKPI